MARSLSLVALLAASPAVSIDPSEPGDTIPFLDGAALRAVERTGPGQGRFVDPATGRSAPVGFGDELILDVAEGEDPGELASALELRVTRPLSPRRGVFLVQSARPGEDALDLAARLAPQVQQGTLEHAYPNLAFRQRALAIEVPPNDPLYADQFFLDDIDIEEAWAVTTGSADISVVVADNGCDLSHPELVDKLDPGVDPIEDDGDPSWKEGQGAEHGTACSGLVAASTDNGVGIAGACPECRLRCARLLPAAGEQVTVASDVLTFEFALEVDADVVSNSWGFVDAIPVPGPLRDAIIDVQQNGRGGKGAVVVFAAGNDGRIVYDDELLAVDGVLGVGAVSSIGELTQYTNGGRSLDVVAPIGAVAPDLQGADGAEPGDFTTTFSGTSSACPIVAGLAGLMIADDPELTADDINEAFMATAKQSLLADPDDEGHDAYFGYGLVQPAAALAFYDPPPPDPPIPEPCGSCAHAPLDAAGLLAFAGLLAARRRHRPRRPLRE